jgi:hypothetical protein
MVPHVIVAGDGSAGADPIPIRRDQAVTAINLPPARCRGAGRTLSVAEPHDAEQRQSPYQTDLMHAIHASLCEPAMAAILGAADRWSKSMVPFFAARADDRVRAFGHNSGLVSGTIVHLWNEQ